MTSPMTLLGRMGKRLFCQKRKLIGDYKLMFLTTRTSFSRVASAASRA